VSVGDFLLSVSRLFAAILTMGDALLLLRYFAHLDSTLLSLLAGCGAAIIVYFLAFTIDCQAVGLNPNLPRANS